MRWISFSFFLYVYLFFNNKLSLMTYWGSRKWTKGIDTMTWKDNTTRKDNTWIPCIQCHAKWSIVQVPSISIYSIAGICTVVLLVIVYLKITWSNLKTVLKQHSKQNASCQEGSLLLLTGVFDYARNGGKRPSPGSLGQVPSCFK